jgi:hypothetical protein
MIDIPDFDLEITLTWVNIVFDALNQAISSWLIHFGYIVYLMIWVTFEAFQLPYTMIILMKYPKLKNSR